VQAESDWFSSGGGAATALLHRDCIAELLAKAAEPRRRGRHIYLDGWTGSGKSVALFSLVNWARRNGWLAMYMPSAYMLVEGGTFHKGEDGLWDTPESAKLLLTSVSDNHASLLKVKRAGSTSPCFPILCSLAELHQPAQGGAGWVSFALLSHFLFSS
jgi:hypothetical protein